MKRRPIRSRWRVAATLVTAVTLGVTSTAAHAMPRDPCEDLRNQQRVHEDLASGYWALAQTMQDLGFTALYQQYRDMSHTEVSMAATADRNLIRLGCG